jgi:ribonuclease J
MNIELFGGVNEVGGNKILVEQNGTRILLDFGTSMGYEGDFFSDFLQPRSNTPIKDRLIIGALPSIPGVYRHDLVVPQGMQHLPVAKFKRLIDHHSPYLLLEDVETYEQHSEKKGRGFIDGIFLSHAHLDHSGAIGFLHPSFPLFCSSTTEILVNAIDDVTSFKSEALTSRSSRLEFTGEKSKFPGSPTIRHDELKRRCITLKDKEIKRLGSLSITHFSQDHSVPGASSCIIDAEGKKLLYTGDIRFHGTYPMTIDDYVKKVGSGIDVMICEGTRVYSDKTLTEADIVKAISDKIKSVKGLVFVDFSWKDTTRYETMKKAARDAGRIFVINARLAYLLDKLRMYPSDEHVKVFLKRKGSCLYSPADYVLSKYEIGLSVDWDVNIDCRHYDNGIVAADIKKHPERYVMMLSYFDLNQIFDFADANGQISDSWLIKAQCAPFCDEMELDEERFIHWLKTFGIGFELDPTPLPDGCSNPTCAKIKKRMKRDHVSGHISRSEIKELIRKVNPKTVIPVHTEEPEEFTKIIDDIASGIDLILPEKGVLYEI